jgi:hypothetical protein
MRAFIFVILFFTGMSGVVGQGINNSSVRGCVKDAQGVEIDVIEVTALHEPTQTKISAGSFRGGNFRLTNLKVGGPYVITIVLASGHRIIDRRVFLHLGEVYKLNLKLTLPKGLDEILLDSLNQTVHSVSGPATTNIGRQQLEALPTIDRRLADFIRLLPQATSTSVGAIGGGNSRQNYVSIDGSDFSNTFGVGNFLPAGGSPVSLDALEEISVGITPFDIRQSGFTGSAINAVTRSGANEFSGSAYTFFRDERMHGNQVGNNMPFKKVGLDSKTYGVRIGGPLKKNKLFFFFNFETTNTTTPAHHNLASTPAAPYTTASNVARPSRSELDNIRRVLKENYNYETGDYDQYYTERENSKFVTRLDWNLNSRHRFAVRYSLAKNSEPVLIGTSRSPLSEYPAAASRTTLNALWFKNSNYYQRSDFHSLSAELNSSFGRFSNMIRASYSYQNEPRESDSEVFPFVDILRNVTPYTSFGYEPFSLGNQRTSKTFSIQNDLSWLAGKHSFTAGVQINMTSSTQGFQRYGAGYYTFNSWDDFVNGVRPVDFAISYSLLPEYKTPYAKIGLGQYALYGQDEISINDRLVVTAGLRIDLTNYKKTDEIQTNPLIAALTFADGRTIDTGSLPDANVLFSPRLGFDLKLLGNGSLNVRGGSGIFTGRVPITWLVSQSADAGMLQYTQMYQSTNRSNPQFFTTPGPFNSDPVAYRPTTQLVPGSIVPSTISLIDRDFKFPQAWKTSLEVEKKIFGLFTATLQGIYGKDINATTFVNPNLVEPVPLNMSTYPDNRMIYPNPTRLKFINPLTAVNSPNPNQPVPSGDVAGTQQFNPIVISNNSGGGYYWSATAKLSSTFRKGISGFVAYTHSEAKNFHDGTGDQPMAVWSRNQIVDRANDPELSYAGYVVPNRVVASLSFRREYLKIFRTTLSFSWEGSIQGRYSYTYSSAGINATGDLNRDGQLNDLIYIPRDQSEIGFTAQNISVGNTTALTYTSEEQAAAFFKYLEEDSYLNSRRGKYAERNGAIIPWRNQLDVKLIQDIFVNIGNKRNTLQLTLDIFNAGNLINKNWGIRRSVNASGILLPSFVSVTGLAPGGTFRPQMMFATNQSQLVTNHFVENNNAASVYVMQAGIRYIFQ